MCRTTIAVCYKAGTTSILQTWIRSVMAHTDVPIRVVIIVSDDDSLREALACSPGHPNIDVELVCPEKVPVSRVHGAMLDAFCVQSIRGINTEFFLTMDSDCFPVADGWLGGLEGMMDSGMRLAGILHPWAPPPEDMDHKKIEWRIRSQCNWGRTHVACQMIRVKDLQELLSSAELKVSYTGGDDTGMMIPGAAIKLGWGIGGYKATRCAKPQGGSDPEFNRYVCLIFGDAVYHHGGFTRITTRGDKPYMREAYDWVLAEMITRRGAEFLLQDDYSYRFKFDRENEIAAEHMNRLFGMTPKKGA